MSIKGIKKFYVARDSNATLGVLRCFIWYNFAELVGIPCLSFCLLKQSVGLAGRLTARLNWALAAICLLVASCPSLFTRNSPRPVVGCNTMADDCTTICKKKAKGVSSSQRNFKLIKHQNQQNVGNSKCGRLVGTQSGRESPPTNS